ncbi:hypothetical protein J6590_031001 [Homalodisca vitripennis]|nr:hypothetical protein J6590_031001 [Homalodisca vitripennis]
MYVHVSSSSGSGQSAPLWLLTPGSVYMKRHNRTSKYEPLVGDVKILMLSMLMSNFPMEERQQCQLVISLQLKLVGIKTQILEEK